MAERSGRKAQDIGQDEAYIVNLKESVEGAKDIAGRNRVMFDTMAINMIVSMGAINSQITRMVVQGATVTEKTAENIVGINETDHLVAQILNSPYGEAMKAIVTAFVAAAQAPIEKKK